MIIMENWFKSWINVRIKIKVEGDKRLLWVFLKKWKKEVKDNG